LAIELELYGKLIWVGARCDMCGVFNALDIASSSSSYGEGFSNVIAEAMSCGVPCVVTDVGDSAFIVKDTGIVVPPDNPIFLSDAWKKVIDSDNLHSMGFKARKRAQYVFNVHRMVASTSYLLNK
jgi:glycosyltransferase involved in cell wall biosynthesis